MLVIVCDACGEKIEYGEETRVKIDLPDRVSLGEMHICPQCVEVARLKSLVEMNPYRP